MKSIWMYVVIIHYINEQLTKCSGWYNDIPSKKMLHFYETQTIIMVEVIEWW